MSCLPAYNRVPLHSVRAGAYEVACFGGGGAHRDEATIRSFGEEWGKFNRFDPAEVERVGNEYFDIVPPQLLGPQVLALDLGCGSGRWSRYLSGRVGRVEAMDPSEAVFHAAAAHSDLANVRWTQAGVDNIPFAPGTFDLTICLGVLHHVPDTAGAVCKAAGTLRPGGHLLLYLYYALDGRGPLYRGLFALSDLLRKGLYRLPGPLKRFLCDLIAVAVYLPLRGLARLMRRMAGTAGWWRKLPLSYYHDKSFTVLRNDALDRFGTPVEQRFTREQVHRMMADAGLSEIVFSGAAPFWHALGRRT
ncbi:MAG: class I SAM-dependent methyltransferase [Flavobacteriales bacterium]|nr:class I SAM-dependent methyltransferase [Flavobacteriales bacterium]